ncbi:MAG: NADH-ubiquinone oxidoreductase-F iron-sulfur binding region domain-containing protein [Candidatus Omnitrophica bacterium]|nr:NADH-ubiquinone oxidoreductase-F iron-sulfur binding region domain-containing protein [Candidatus Omnitrophota bacterium]MDD5429103.1 NADH-ubiquinone oxidoreductase-F iron-sulfur binding region domain-containing protein [Candidatus Omnitrophota bacterium]
MYRKTIFIKDTDSQGLDRTKEFYNKFLENLRSRNLQNDIQVARAADIGIYNQGIVLRVYGEDTIYVQLKETDIDNIISLTIEKNEIISSLQYKKKDKQLRRVLRNCGVINPDCIEDYLANGGYQGLYKVLTSLKPEEVIKELKISGLRGRGGGGFPTWMKWDFALKTESDQKYIICNGDEGDPGAYMDRSVLEGDPHSVIEGMIIAGYTIGASKGYFYIRAEYPLAIERIQNAIDQAYSKGLIGEKILNSGFNFDLSIRLGAGAFVCGEETALIASIEGKRGTPLPRPPYPSVKGLWSKPTVINNVETLANVAYIFIRGAKEFAKLGTETSKGTKVFALTGKVKNSGLIEVPMGTTLREIVFDVGGGVLDNKNIKAVQTGGPSGGVIPAQYLDTPVDYENLSKLGSIMGSGGMIVMDETDCMVDIAKFYLGFCVEESCGKCAPCRIGGSQMLDILTRISKGQAQNHDLETLSRISFAMQKASLCGLGQTAPNPVVSTLKHFLPEYKEHTENKRCPAGKCLDLLSYKIIDEKCKRCGACVRICPVSAISGNREHGYSIDTQKCTKCGQCISVCKFKAISKE